MAPEMTTIDGAPSLPKWRGFVVFLLGFMGLFAVLCTIFALLVTAAEAWVEHPQAQWPTATARVQRCGLDIYTYGSNAYWIDCSLSYTVHGEEIVSHVHSRTIPDPRRVIWQYPKGRFEQLQEWVDEHPEGTPIAVHYDPANYKKAVLVTTDMPLGGPRTPNNLKLLEFCAISAAVLLTIARVLRPRADAVRGVGDQGQQL
jgi:uncharacterized protein DUF3592